MSRLAKRPKRRNMLRRSIVAALVLACGSEARAQTFTWDAGAGNADGRWSTPANWAGDGVPASRATLVLPQTRGAAQSAHNDFSGLLIHGPTLDGHWQVARHPLPRRG